MKGTIINLKNGKLPKGTLDLPHQRLRERLVDLFISGSKKNTAKWRIHYGKRVDFILSAVAEEVEACRQTFILHDTGQVMKSELINADDLLRRLK